MNILPMLLYFFQSLAIWILVSVLRMLDKLISTFIWYKRKPRIKLKQLAYPKSQGGLNLPNLKLYYWAAKRGGMAEWLMQDEEKNWLQLENRAHPWLLRHCHFWKRKCEQNSRLKMNA